MSLVSLDVKETPVMTECLDCQEVKENKERTGLLVHLVPWVHPVSKERKVLQVFQDVKENEDLMDHPDPQEVQVPVVRMVNKESVVSRDLQDFQGNQACRERGEPMETQERTVFQVFKDVAETRDLQAHQDSQDPLVSLVYRVSKDHQDHQDQEEKEENGVNQVSQEYQELWDHQDHLVPPVYKERKVHLVRMEKRVTRVGLDYLVCKELLDLRV